MPKTNKKDKIGNQKNLLVNFIFLKVVVSNICDVFGTKPFYTINEYYISNLQYKKENFLAYID